MAIDFTSMSDSTAPTVEVEPSTVGTGISLNLQKNSLLDLEKASPGLNLVDLAAGWDITSGGDGFDLDISVLLCNEAGKITSANDVVFYNNTSAPGINLNGDNRTGVGDGDDEIISIQLNAISSSVHKIICCITIHDAATKHQTFGMVANSYIRLVNKESGAEIARYTLKDDYSTSTAVVFAELVRDDEKWIFHTIGDGLVADLNQIAARFQ